MNPSERLKRLKKLEGVLNEFLGDVALTEQSDALRKAYLALSDAETQSFRGLDSEGKIALLRSKLI